MEPVLQIKGNRFAYLLLSLLAAGFSVLFILFVFTPDVISVFTETPVTPDSVPVIGKIIFTILAIAGIFLFYNWMKMFVNNPAVLCIYTDGFTVNTNGISSGFIAWYNVSRIEEVAVSSNAGTGSRAEASLAVYLKDYEGYQAQMPGLFRLIYKLAGKSGRYRYTDRKNVTHDDVPLFIPVAVFGKQYAEAKQLLYKGAGQATEL